MRGISVGVIREEEEKDEDIRNGKRESDRGGSWAGLLVHPQHRRTKSASDRNFYGFRGKDQNVTDGSLQQSGSAHVNKSMSSKHRASLEKDIEQLQSRLKQERSMRLVLERAMGRASSTLSPGHRHFAAQTKELMAEIESLEEEVSSREQHVLTMYRNIFEQCVTRPSSQQSSMMASPAHPKQEGARKHPTIISTAFCSSKNFPFRSPFQALVDPGKRSRDDPATAKNLRSGPTKVEAIMGKASMARTLREHLHECPSKLSEEMVRCMAAVYCWLRTRENRSPFPSRSCTNVVQPRQDVCPASMLHISSISSDKTHFARASYAITTYRLLVEQLQKVSVSLMPIDAQTAFWINVYNALIMHAYLAYGIPNTSFRRLALFQKAAYNIGGRIISANAIEHSIFCFRTPRVGWWLETILLATLRKKSGEDKQLSSKLGLPNSQPIVCFALCTGAFSDPVLRVYTALNVKEELEEATREFLQSNVVVKKTRKVFLPKLLERFAREACYGSDDLLKWLVQNVDNKLGDSIQKCLDSNKSGKKISEWLPYSSRFRYVFSKGLAQKPWWL